MARTGREYLDGLRSRPREVWLGGRRVDDVTTHPGLAGTARTVAGLYDLQHRADLRADLLADGVPRSLVPPRDAAGLRARDRAYRIVAEETFGLLGRSPDFLGTAVTLLGAGAGHFAAVDPRFGANVRAFREQVRDGDLFLTHALLPPQTDRSRDSAGQAEDLLHLGVHRETADGLVVRGARMLATLGPLADELLVYCLPGLRPGEERHALAFAIPVGTPGLRMICRAPFDDGTRGSFDHPLSSRFDEPDALVVFDDVLVPWDRVFLHGDVTASNRMYDAVGLGPHLAHQTGVRGLVKLRFAVAVAAALAEAVRVDTFLPVQQRLAEGVMAVDIADGLLTAALQGARDRDGVWTPAEQPLRTLRLFLAEAYPKAVSNLQVLGAGGLLMTPMQADFGSPIAADVHRYYQGADALPATERVALFRLAYELTCDGFGQRQVQYERYYGGDPVRLAAQHQARTDPAEGRRMVARARELAGEPVPALAGSA
ncbi:4-hydroxyphenylacetate 3-monooxygenase, oxygenase component [Pseudonocardia kongjuensis]|uniref:4-hydroxyphenylacetate 3-monooxygenase, oxygenase component n=1 Tax=Pseudonocardia kongjuensis TaxID=102227 RepID=A0ABP4IS01_9PSEU